MVFDSGPVLSGSPFSEICVVNSIHTMSMLMPLFPLDGCLWDGTSCDHCSKYETIVHVVWKHSKV